MFNFNVSINYFYWYLQNTKQTKLLINLINKNAALILIFTNIWLKISEYKWFMTYQMLG